MTEVHDDDVDAQTDYATMLVVITSADAMTRERRAELLAVADPQRLTSLASELLLHRPPPTIVARPEVGTIVMQVREPICRDRFHLGEIVVTRAVRA